MNSTGFHLNITSRRGGRRLRRGLAAALAVFALAIGVSAVAPPAPAHADERRCQPVVGLMSESRSGGDSHTVLDIGGGFTSGNSPFIAFNHHGDWNQEFTLCTSPGKVGFQIANPRTGMCVGVENPRPQGLRHVVLTGCDWNNGTTRWAWNHGDRLMNVSTANCMDAMMGWTSHRWVIDFPCHANPNQRWRTFPS